MNCCWSTEAKGGLSFGSSWSVDRTGGAPAPEKKGEDLSSEIPVAQQGLAAVAEVAENQKQSGCTLGWGDMNGDVHSLALQSGEAQEQGTWQLCSCDLQPWCKAAASSYKNTAFQQEVDEQELNKSRYQYQEREEHHKRNNKNSRWSCIFRCVKNQKATGISTLNQMIAATRGGI